MLSLTIPFHSFVDLITNSSTQVFISATDNTLDAIKKIVEALLVAGGSKFTVDQMFDIQLLDDPNYSDEDQRWYESDDCWGRRKKAIVVKTKIPSEAATVAADLLGKLAKTFDLDSRRNG